MKLLQQVFMIIFLMAVSLFFSRPIQADIPRELEFVLVFDYEEAPIDGLNDVVFRLYTSGELVYMEKISDVDFDHGVGTVIVGGEDTDLINDYFDDIDMEVSFSVLQHQLFFPVHSVPYSIRSLESNKARRIDNETLIYFDEDNERVGVNNNLEPEVSLHINGGIKLGNLLATDTVENGVMYWHGNTNSFYGYADDEWQTMSYYPDESDQSKWTISDDESYIVSTQLVGIGMPPNLYQLAVSGNIAIDGDLEVGMDVHITDFMMLDSGDGFQSDAQLIVDQMVMSSGNSWIDGDVMFTGILYGNGEDLTNLSDFGEYVFESEHFETDLLYEQHIQDDIIQLQHISPQSIHTFNVEVGNVSADYIIDYSIQSEHISPNSIQVHHMIVDSITSADIKYNVFGKEKFQDDVVLSHHIVDFQISSNKIQTRNILSEHIQDDSITSDLIKNNTITSSKIPLQSIRTENLTLVFPIENGGTGQTEFDEFGVLFVTSSEAVSANSNVISIEDGHLGIGATDSDVSFLIQESASASVVIDSEDDYQTSLLLTHDSASWNVHVDSDGHLNIESDSMIAMTFDSNGYVGVATENPVESLTLSGPILLGEPNATAGNYSPGTIFYSGGQFYLCLTESVCDSITLSSAYQRHFQMGAPLVASSVIYTNRSSLFGERLFVNDVQGSMVDANMMQLDMVKNSRIFGERSRVGVIQDSDLDAQGSHLNFVYSSAINSSDSDGFLLENSTVDMMRSQVQLSARSELNLMASSGFFIHDSNGQMIHSNASFSNDSTFRALNSSARFISGSDIQMSSSNAQFLTRVNGLAIRSELDRLNDVEMSVHDSYLSNLSRSDLVGQNQFVVDAANAMVHGHNILSMNGDGQVVESDFVVAVGSNITAMHDHTLLLNASDQPLVSDRDGQLKIQADGDVRIQFSDEVGMSMVDGVGRHISDRNLKFNVSSIDPQIILNKVRELPIYYWQYKSQNGIQHIGPTSQDFSRIFQYGNSDKVIHSIDSDGVLLASIQGLNAQLVSLKNSIQDYQIRSENQWQQYDELFQTVDRLIERANVLDQSFASYSYKLDQFESDYDTQVSMIRYIEDITRKVELRYYLHVANQLWVWGLLVMVGFLCSIIVQWMVYKGRRQ